MHKKPAISDRTWFWFCQQFWFIFYWSQKIVWSGRRHKLGSPVLFFSMVFQFDFISLPLRQMVFFCYLYVVRAHRLYYSSMETNEKAIKPWFILFDIQPIKRQTLGDVTLVPASIMSITHLLLTVLGSLYILHFSFNVALE